MQQLALDTEDEPPARDESHAAQDAAMATLRAEDTASLSESFVHEVDQPLAAIVASAYACARWLAADPPNIERAKISAERIVRDANAAATIVGRLQRNRRLRASAEVKGANGRD
jgi:hypothetical protein